MSDGVQSSPSWLNRLAVIAAITTGIVMARMRVLDKLVAGVGGMLGFGSDAGQQSDHPSPVAGKEVGTNAQGQAAEVIRAPITPGVPSLARGR